MNLDSACSIFEFGAGCTRFSWHLESDLRSKVSYDVQDVTYVNFDYLKEEADSAHIGKIQDVDNNYDIIFSTFVWEHITDPQSTLQHLLILLKPGGSIFIVSPRYEFPFYISPSEKHLSKIKRFF
ncbi:MAG: methyltransferase domain-containing protein [Cyanobacteria bacterium P01_F01_bin.150]